ncbi:Ras-related protein Rab [Acrasis kona]|uniref:Ras-related protein Rab n=1 Tax=Acrasis kona TaxID=1008807 RepID=A0AAW2ZDM8_9EUKA
MSNVGELYQDHLINSQLKRTYDGSEILIHIFQFLPPHDILRMSLVNSLWNEQASSNFLWKNMTQRAIKMRFNFDGSDVEEDLTSKVYQNQVMDWRKLYFAIVGSRWRWRRGIRNSTDRHDHLFKVMILGDKKVGKSTLLLRMVKEDIKKDVISEQISKYEMSHKTCTVVDVLPPHSAVKLQIYDSNIIDMAQYVKTCRKYSCVCHAVVIVYNVAQKRTFFNAINKWLNMVRNQNLSCNVFLVANKSDFKEMNHQVNTTEAEAIAQSKVSAIKASGTEDLVAAITNVIHRRVVQNEDYETRWPDILAAKHSLHIRFFFTLMQVPKKNAIQNDEHAEYTESAISAPSTETNDKNVGSYDEEEVTAIIDDDADETENDYNDGEFYDVEDPEVNEFVSLTMFRKQKPSDKDYFSSLVIGGTNSPTSPHKGPRIVRRLRTGSLSHPSTDQDEFSLAETESHQPTIHLASVQRAGKRQTKKYTNDVLWLSENPDASTEDNLNSSRASTTMTDTTPHHAEVKSDELDGTGLTDAIIIEAMNKESEVVASNVENNTPKNLKHNGKQCRVM